MNEKQIAELMIEEFEQRTKEVQDFEYEKRMKAIEQIFFDISEKMTRLELNYKISKELRSFYVE